MSRRTRMLFAAILTGLLVAAALPAADADYKIDRNLMKKLTDDEQAVVPFFVVFGDRPDLSRAHSMTNRAERGRFVVQSLRGAADRSQNGVRGYLRGRKVAFTPFWVENKVYVPGGTLELARALAGRPEVAAVLPEIIYTVPQPLITQDAGTQAIEWNISRIRATDVWTTYGTKGTGLVVANIDTGVQYNHPALVSQYRGNTGSGFSHAGNWYDPAGICGGAPCDNVGHGTHTMGTMVGDDGVANTVGVAPQAKWIACKGCESSSCSGASLSACAQWVMDPFKNGSGTGRPDAVNNSWGGGSGDSWYQSYIQNWNAAGIFPAFSIGNSGSACGTANSPGDNPAAFASGATDSGDLIASFSSRGPSLFGGIIKPDISAPGVSVRSSVPTSSYAYYSGTSMASPHTAGAVALLWAVRPAYRANISGTESLLRSNAAILDTTETCGGLPAHSTPNNTYGYGLLNVKAAADSAGGPVNLPPTVHISSPANGAQIACGTTVTFAATVTDPEGEILTPAWTDNGASIGSGSPTKSYLCSETGSHNIVAKATDSAGNTGSDSVTVTVFDPSTPTMPGNFAAAASATSVVLTWTDSQNETSYRLERKQKNGRTWTAWAIVTSSIAANATSYTDTSVVSRGQYQYRLYAVSGTKESTPAGPVSVRVK